MMTKVSGLVLLTLLLSSHLGADPAVDLEGSMHALATTLAESLVQGEVRKIAVVEFSDLGGYSSALGLFIAEELTTQLFAVRPGAFDVVERQQLVRVLEEQKLSTSSLFDAANIENLGRILGIQAVVTGTIADLGEEVKINARAISVATAKVFAAASAKCPKDSTVQTLLRQGAAAATSGDPAALTPSPGRQVQASDVFFQNSFLRLTVSSVAISEDREEVTLGLQLENLTTQDLHLALELELQHCQARLIDNRGTQLEPAGAYGSGATGIICLSMGRSAPEAEEFTLFSGKSRSTILIRFQARRREGVMGDVFAFAGNFLRLQGGKVSRFAAGISNIELGR